MTNQHPPLNPIPAHIVAVNDYVPYAKQRLSLQAWAYFSGGSADETLLGRNNHAFNHFSIWPRALADLSQAHTTTQLLGSRHPFPIFLAPIAYQRMAHSDGELATALAAAAMQTPFIISMQASCSLEHLVEQAPGPKWLQWYWQADKNATKALLAKAQALNIEAIVLTVDAPVNGLRNTEQRAQFMLPLGVEAVNLKGFKQPNNTLGAAGSSPLFGSGFLANAPNWQQVATFISDCPLPVILKGIMHPADAKRAVEIGAKGLIVSNHGGRTLDAAPTSLEVLPLVCKAVEGQIPVLFDGGIRRGSDVFIALALGASAVLVGRPYIYGLAAAGAPGVAHVLHLLRTELEVTMALAGCATLDDVTPDCLYGA